jgi:hypothetical protein
VAALLHPLRELLALVFLVLAGWLHAKTLDTAADADDG